MCKFRMKASDQKRIVESTQTIVDKVGDFMVPGIQSKGIRISTTIPVFLLLIYKHPVKISVKVIFVDQL